MHKWVVCPISKGETVMGRGGGGEGRGGGGEGRRGNVNKINITINVALIYMSSFQICRADIMVCDGIDVFGRDDILQNYPKLSALRKRVYENPNIAAYLAKRPKTQF